MELVKSLQGIVSASSRKMINLLETQHNKEHNKTILETDKLGRTSLHNLVISNKVDEVKKLLPNDELINAKDNNECTPLHYAKHVDVVKILCEFGADLNAINKYLQTALHIWARKSNGSQRIHHILKLGAKNNEKDYLGRTALHEACINKMLDNVQVLLYHGANVMEEDNKGFIPIMRAIEKEDEDIINELWLYLDQHAINHLNCYGDTMLMLLLRKKSKLFIMKLLEMHPILDYIDQHNFDSLDLSIFMSDSECMQVMWTQMKTNDDFCWKLFLTGCNFESKDFVQTTHFLISKAHLDGLRFFDLVDAFINFEVNKEDCIGITYSLYSYGYEGDVKEITGILDTGFKYKFELMRIMLEFVPMYLLQNPFCRSALKLFYYNDNEYYFLNDYVPLWTFSYEKLLCWFLSQVENLRFIRKSNLIKLLSNIRQYLHYTYGSLSVRTTYDTYWNAAVLEEIFTSDYNVGDESIVTFDELKHYSRVNSLVIKQFKVPSLLEMCRNFIRDFLINKFNYGETHFTAVRNIFVSIENMEIPYSLKEVLLFRRPIYKCNYDCCKNILQ